MNLLLLVLLGIALLIYGIEMLPPTVTSEERVSRIFSLEKADLKALAAGNYGQSEASSLDEDSAANSAEALAEDDNKSVAEAESGYRGPGTPVFNFNGQEPEWNIVNDTVMGGISNSAVLVDEEMQRLTFFGNVSLENRGGFASTRSQWATYNLERYDGIVLRVLGDGHIYRFRIRTEAAGPDISYTALFKTEADVWQEVYIPFAEMVPLYRGFVVNDAGLLDASSVRSFGLMVADKQEGEFLLQVDWINAVREKSNEVKYVNF